MVRSPKKDLDRQCEECSQYQIPVEIPVDIADSLSSYGGIEGLIQLLPPDEMINSISSMYNACSDPIRVKIILMLNIQPLCVCVIKAVTKISDSKLSYHLNVLKKADLIYGEQRGTWIIYTLTDEGVRIAETIR